ncbi:MAG: HAMP domain-containing protein [Nitrospiraceae bacterium]|nr:MAG: HAMP domain-containing protein [Nitrospiraceae bacterium]
MFFTIRDKIFYRLNTKITVAIVMSLLAVLGASTYVIEEVQRRDTLRKAEESGFFISSTLLSNLEYHMIKNDRGEITQFMEDMNKSREIETASIIKEDGQIVYSTNPNSIGMKISASYISNFLEMDKEQVMNTGFKSGRRVLSVVTRLSNSKECFSCHDRNRQFLGIMLVDISMTPTEKLIIENRNRLIFSSIVAMISVSLILFFLNNRYIYRPVKKLKKVIDGVKQGDLTVKEDYPIKDEIGHLGDSLNAMVESLNNTNRELRESYKKHLYQTEKLVAIGQLTSGIIHEIQSPLTGVYFSLKALKDDEKEGSEAGYILERVLIHLDKVMNMAKKQLSFIKPSRSMLEHVNLNDLVEGALFLVVKQAEKQKIRILKKFTDNLPEVYAEPDNLKLVFLNLLLNAIQSMPSGGSLRIISGVSPDNGSCYVSFSDSGPGIPDHEMSRVFEPFFTTKENGTGLGLFISKGVIEAQGGEIVIESRQGTGTTFTVKLPAGARVTS